MNENRTVGQNFGVPDGIHRVTAHAVLYGGETVVRLDDVLRYHTWEIEGVVPEDGMLVYTRNEKVTTIARR